MWVRNFLKPQNGARKTGSSSVSPIFYEGGKKRRQNKRTKKAWSSHQFSEHQLT
jgi:hypothetical protein